MDSIQRERIVKIQATLKPEDYVKHRGESALERAERLALLLTNPERKAQHAEMARLLREDAQKCIEENNKKPEEPDDPDAVILSREQALEMGPTFGQRFSWTVLPFFERSIEEAGKILASKGITDAAWIGLFGINIVWIACSGMIFNGILLIILEIVLTLTCYLDTNNDICKPLTRWIGFCILGAFICLCVFGWSIATVQEKSIFIKTRSGVVEKIWICDTPPFAILPAPKFWDKEKIDWFEDNTDGEKTFSKKIKKEEIVKLGFMQRTFSVEATMILDLGAVEKLVGKPLPDFKASQNELRGKFEKAFDEVFLEAKASPNIDMQKSATKKMQSLHNEYYVLMDIEVK